ncbi:hypothetical protein D030_0325A, partial [Vibrio parahaemolyticus AQ3810]
MLAERVCQYLHLNKQGFCRALLLTKT